MATDLRAASRALRDLERRLQEDLRAELLALVRITEAAELPFPHEACARAALAYLPRRDRLIREAEEIEEEARRRAQQETPCKD